MTRLVNEVVMPFAGMHLLDFGCGNGRLVKFLPGVTYTGVDNNPSYVGGAQSTLASRDVKFYCQDLNELAGMGLEPVDVVVCIGVLHHLSQDVAIPALGAAAALLREGGRLITMDPCFEPSQSPVARVLMALDRGKFVRHPEGYRELISHSFRVTSERLWDDVYKFPYTHFVTESTPI